MAKITRHGGASDATLPEAEVEVEPTPAAEPAPESEPETVEAPAVEPEPEPDEEPSSEAAEPGPEQDYEDLTVEELKELLAERGLPKSGKRDDLVQRLRDDDAAAGE